MEDDDYEDWCSGCLVDAIGLAILCGGFCLIGGILYEAWKVLR